VSLLRLDHVSAFYGASQALFYGADMAGVPEHRAARAGIGLVSEGRRCFGNLTVRENLIAAARKGPWHEAAVAALFARLGEGWGPRAHSLSGGEQQMLAIARALMTTPRLLILEEATEGLAPVIRQEIWAAIARLRGETGVAILVIDKSLAELRQLADRAVVLEKGSTVWSGALDRLSPETYLGV
jgi:branched-chain amino acid transport system ATP-binding protein